MICAFACTCRPGDETPVCGSDGITYPSRCDLSCAKFLKQQRGQQPRLEVNYVHDGPCEK